MKIGQSLESMQQGGGAYDSECEQAYRACEAESVLLAVINGKKGNGFSVVATRRVADALPTILRSMADSIEEQMKQAANS